MLEQCISGLAMCTPNTHTSHPAKRVLKQGDETALIFQDSPRILVVCPR